MSRRWTFHDLWRSFTQHRIDCWKLGTVSESWLNHATWRGL